VSSWLAGNFTIKMEVFTGKIMENHRTRWVMFQPCLITRGNPQFTALHTTLDHSIPVASVALAMNHPSNQPEKKKVVILRPKLLGCWPHKPNWGW
jgi:hypothetical protein